MNVDKTAMNITAGTDQNSLQDGLPTNATSLADFDVAEDTNGPTLAAAVAVIMILSVSANLFIVTFSMCRCMTLKEPSMIYLSSLALGNLIGSTVVMPFTIIAAASGEWLPGGTLEVKEISCWIVGFVFSAQLSLSVHLIGLISFDRFLLIVKPFLYKRVMKQRVAYISVTITWVYSMILATPPFYGLGSFGFSRSMASCLPLWNNSEAYPKYTLAAATPVFTVIIVTTIWTFVATRKFLRREHNRRMFAAVNTNMEEHERSIYSYRIWKLIGLFGMIMVVNFVSFLPFFIIFCVGLIIGYNNIPSPAYATALIFILLYNFMLPVVQSIFRHDIRESVLSISKRLRCMCHSHMSVADATHPPAPHTTLNQRIDLSCDTIATNISDTSLTAP